MVGRQGRIQFNSLRRCTQHSGAELQWMTLPRARVSHLVHKYQRNRPRPDVGEEHW